MTQFKDLAEANEFVDKLNSMLEDGRLHAWLRECDEDFGTNTEAALADIHARFQGIITTIES